MKAASCRLKLKTRNAEFHSGQTHAFNSFSREESHRSLIRAFTAFRMTETFQKKNESIFNLLQKKGTYIYTNCIR